MIGIILWGIVGTAYILKNSGGRGVSMPYEPTYTVDEGVKKKLLELSKLKTKEDEK